MSKSNTWENDLLLLVFNNTAVTLIGDAAGLLGSAAPGLLYLSLHTADLTDAGSQTSSETSYTGYTRVSVVRSAAGWTVTLVNVGPSTVSNAALVTFPLCTGGSSTVTHVGVGTSLSGAGKLLYHGALTSSLAISNNITPSYAANTLTITEA